VSRRDESDDDGIHGGDGDDALVDHCLQQILGDRRPPDLATRVAMATERERAAAAAAVDAATEPRPVAPAKWLLAAAAAAVVVLGCAWAFFTAAAVPSPSVQEQAYLLLDRFHAAMPRDPAQLRDADCRADVESAAIPVIRSIVALHATDPTETVFGTRAVEFEIYGVVLGDAELRGGLQRRADHGDVVATAALRIADAILGDEAVRRRLLADLAPTLVATGDVGPSLVRCLAIADLSAAELEAVAGAIDEPQLERALRQAVELAARSPRRWLGQQLELFGRLVDDRLFSSAELAGRPVLVCFWASWCRPSVDMRERLRELQRRHPEVAVVGVSCDHDSVALRRALAAAGDDGWIHFHDAARPGWHEFAVRCDIGLLPTVLVLDRAGIVRGVEVGLADTKAIERALRR
jgi:Thioredoxin-like